jgi:hypothetical protein
MLPCLRGSPPSLRKDLPLLEAVLPEGVDRRTIPESEYCPSHQLPSSPDFGQYFYYNHIMSRYGALAGLPWDDDCEDDNEMDLFEVGGGDSKMLSPSTSKVVSGPPTFPPEPVTPTKGTGKSKCSSAAAELTPTAPTLVPP